MRHRHDLRVVNLLRSPQKVEVHEVDGASSLHHQVCRDRRVDASGEERDHASAGADRKPAQSRNPADKDISLFVIDLNRERDVGVPQIDRCPDLIGNPASDLSIYLGRGVGELLVTPCSADAEAGLRRDDVTCQHHRSLADYVHIERCRGHRGDVSDTGEPAEPCLHLARRGSLRGLDDDVSVRTGDLRVSEIS